VLVLKIALGIILAFVIIGAAQCVLAVALVSGIRFTTPQPTIRAGGGLHLATTPRTATPRTTPQPSPVREVRAARVTFTVLDAATGRPVSGVCITVDRSDCETGAVLTDPSGQKTLDIPSGSTVSLWHPNYIPLQRQFTASAEHMNVTIWLSPSP
jgi:hypothetical protein